MLNKAKKDVAVTRVNGPVTSAFPPALLESFTSRYVQGNKQKSHIKFVLMAIRLRSHSRRTRLCWKFARRFGFKWNEAWLRAGRVWDLHVLVNGRSILSCLMLGLDAEGQEIKTIEGMQTAPNFILARHVCRTQVPRRWLLLAGFSAGRRRAAEERSESFARGNPEALSGNLCRCTGYIKITKLSNSPQPNARRRDGTAA